LIGFLWQDKLFSLEIWGWRRKSFVSISLLATDDADMYVLFLEEQNTKMRGEKDEWKKVFPFS